MAVAVALAAGPLPALAQEPDAIRVVAGGSVTHDSNVFKTSESLPVSGALSSPSRSDTVKSAYAGLRVDVPWSLQRFQLDLTRSQSRYDRLEELDFDATQYRGAWLWHATPRVGGALSTERTESPVPFTEFQAAQRNVRVTQRHAFTLDGRVSGSWHAVLGISRDKQESEIPLQAQADYDLDRAEVGAKYLAPSGSLVAFAQRAGRGNYDRAPGALAILEDDFKQRETELQASWIITGKSTLNGRVTWIDRRHDNLPERDVSGWSGEAGYALRPSGKLGLRASARRDLVPYFSTESTHRLDETLSVGPTWQATAKVGVSLTLERMQSDFRGIPSAGRRKDRLDRAELGVVWSPLRFLTLGASLQRQRRTSSDSEFAFEADVASLSASLIF